MIDWVNSFSASGAPLLNRSVVIGFFSLLHIALAAPAVALMILAPLVEWAGIRRPFFTEEARTMTRFTMATFAASSVLAVFMIELFIGLFPLTNAWVFNRFRPALYLACAAFLLMTAALLAYFFWWDEIRAKSVRLHIQVGAVAAVFVVLWAAVLDGIGSHMLTPSSAQTTWGALLNPTWVPLVLHRVGGDLATAGYLASAYAAWMMARRRGHPDEAYYLHFFKLSFGAGLLGLLMQPLTGWLYAVRIEEMAPEAYTQLVAGAYQGWIYAQFLLIGLLLFGSYAVLRAGLPAYRPPVWRGSLFILSTVLMIAFVGTPDLRRAFTFLAAGLLLWQTIALRHQLLAAGPQELNRPGIRFLAAGLAVVSIMTYLTMGIVRETARRPDTVRGHISLQDEAAAPAAFR